MKSDMVADLIDTIDITIAGIGDLTYILQELPGQTPGAQCLWILHKKLEADMDKLDKCLRPSLKR